MPAGDRLKATALDQITAINRKHSQLLKKDRFTQFGGGARPDDYAEFNAMCLAAIDRITGRHDSYYEQALREIDRHNVLISSELAHSLYGLVRAIERDVEGGSLITFREIEHASLFNELLDLAEWRAGRGSFEAAVGIMRAVLEIHLQHLAAKYNLPLCAVNPGVVKPRIGPQQFNDELAQVAYGQPEHQNVTSWLAFAARPNTGRERITVFVQELRGFIMLYPA